MTAPDTNAAAVERLAAFHALMQKGYDADEESGLRACAATTAAMLRALLKERDAAREAAARLREALLGALTAHGFTKERVASVVGDNWVSHARAALARGGEGG